MPVSPSPLKRAFDVAGAVLGLLAAAPLGAVIAAAIWLDDGGPVFFTQPRCGRGGATFSIYKFRSLHTGEKSNRRPGEHATRVGGVLRRWALDELPQVVNVLRGEMSFVGPRPERPEFVRRLEANHPRYADRHHVKPGLTGWAQISYPYGASDEDALQKLQYDLYYVKNRSVYLDLTILLQTAEVVLWGKGAR